MRDVWDDLCDDPTEANEMRQRSIAMLVLKTWLKTHAKRARRLLTAEQIKGIRAGEISKFKSDELRAIASTVGVVVR